MDHLGKCSPCYNDYTKFRRLADRRRRLTYLGIAAVIVVAAVSVWVWRSRQPTVITAHNHVVADMRNRPILRGEQGHRPKRGAQGVIGRVQKLPCARYTDGVDADLSRYFDKTPHR